MTIFSYLAWTFLAYAHLLSETQATGISSIRDARPVDEPPIVAISATLSARSTTSDVVHDKIFIPTIATMGALVIVALVCCYMIAVNRLGGQIPRGTNWAVPSHAAPDRVYNPEPTKTGTERDSQNITPLGRRMSKAQRKSPPPFLPGPSNMAPQPFGAGQAPYPYATPQYGMSNIPSNAPGTQQDHRYWGPDAPRVSMLSSAQSATEVGSNGASPAKTKPYTTVGGYGFSNQNVAPPEFGTQRSQPSTVVSQNYNPYDGIDHTYNPNQSGRSR